MKYIRTGSNIFFSMVSSPVMASSDNFLKYIILTLFLGLFTYPVLKLFKKHHILCHLAVSTYHLSYLCFFLIILIWKPFISSTCSTSLVKQIKSTMFSMATAVNIYCNIHMENQYQKSYNFHYLKSTFFYTYPILKKKLWMVNILSLLLLV